MSQTAEQIVIHAVAESAGREPESITQADTFESLGMDELDVIEAVIEVESMADVDLDDDVFERFTTVGELVAEVERVRGEQ